jgi:hypothetical protein
MWARAATVAIFIGAGLVGEVSAHGLSDETQFVRWDSLAYNIDLAIGPKESEGLSGLVQPFVGRKTISGADQDQKVSGIASSYFSGLKESRIPIDQECPAHSVSAKQGATGYWPKMNGHTRNGITQFLQFSGGICSRHWLPVRDSIYVSRPISNHKRQHIRMKFDADRRCIASVFQFIFQRNVPAQTGTPSPIIISERTSNLNLDGNPRTVGTFRPFDLGIVFGNDILNLKATGNDERDYAGDDHPKSSDLITISPPNSSSDTNQYRTHRQQPNNHNLHRFSLHEVLFAAFVLFCTGLGLGGFLGVWLAAIRHRSAKYPPV